MSTELPNTSTPPDGWYPRHGDPDQRLTGKNDARDYGGHVIGLSILEPVVQLQESETADTIQLDLFSDSRIRDIIEATRDKLPKSQRDPNLESKQAATRAMAARESAGMAGVRTSGLPNFPRKG